MTPSSSLLLNDTNTPAINLRIVQLGDHVLHIAICCKLHNADKQATARFNVQKNSTHYTIMFSQFSG